MRVLVLGGTVFIGRAAVEVLVGSGHEVLVSHRGRHEPLEGAVAAVPHLHADRAELASVADEVARFGPEAVVDCLAMTGAGASAALAALPDPDLRWVVLSSMDVYRAFAALQHGEVSEPVPVDERSPTRPDRRPYPGADYSKLEVEELVLDRGACVLRLPMVYGPFDPQRREEPLLRRVRAGREAIPCGAMNGTLPMGLVSDVAAGIVRAVERPEAAGEVVNLCEELTRPVALWASQILAAAGTQTSLVPVPEERLPEDLGLLGTIRQPLVASSAKARRLLDYTDTPWEEAIATSVAWHLLHPPAPSDAGFTADDEALAAAR